MQTNTIIVTWPQGADTERARRRLVEVVTDMLLSHGGNREAALEGEGEDTPIGSLPVAANLGVGVWIDAAHGSNGQSFSVVRIQPLSATQDALDDADEDSDIAQRIGFLLDRKIPCVDARDAIQSAGFHLAAATFALLSRESYALATEQDCAVAGLTQRPTKGVEGELRTGQGTQDDCYAQAGAALDANLEGATQAVDNETLMREEAQELLSELDIRDLYAYSVNLDERGSFYADVRDIFTDKTVYEVRSDDDRDGEIPEVTDGFMRHKTDMDGLCSTLIDRGVIPANARVVALGDADRAYDRALDAIGDLHANTLITLRDLAKPAEPASDVEPAMSM